MAHQQQRHSARGSHVWSDNKVELLLKITLDYKANKTAFNASFPHVKKSLQFLSFEFFNAPIFSGLKRVCVPTNGQTP